MKGSLLRKIQELKNRQNDISFALIEADEENLLQLERELDTIELELNTAQQTLEQIDYEENNEQD